MSSAVPDVVNRYFELSADRDIDRIVALFTDGATVVDEGETRHGTAAIRGWQTGTASRYEYTTTVITSEATGANRYRIRAHLEGNFPGGAVDLNHDFEVEGNRISSLVIAP